MSKLEIFGVAALAVTAGALYVLVHEARRKHKKAIKLAAEEPISKEMLLKILNKSAEASKTVIERIRVEVRKVQQAKNLPDDQALMLFQQNFEHSLDQLIGAIRNQYNVTEKAMDASFKQHQSDPEVQQAIQNMRALSTGSGAGAAGGGAATPSSSSGAAAARSGGAAKGGKAKAAELKSVELPASLTKDRLREIMTFNAVMFEKELRPIKEEIQKMRISEAVMQRFEVSDDQVMAAIEHFGAKNDPSFKDILSRIATTLSSSLG